MFAARAAPCVQLLNARQQRPGVKNEVTACVLEGGHCPGPVTIIICVTVIPHSLLTRVPLVVSTRIITYDLALVVFVVALTFIFFLVGEGFSRNRIQSLKIDVVWPELEDAGSPRVQLFGQEEHGADHGEAGVCNGDAYVGGFAGNPSFSK